MTLRKGDTQCDSKDCGNNKMSSVYKRLRVAEGNRVKRQSTQDTLMVGGEYYYIFV